MKRLTLFLSGLVQLGVASWQIISAYPFAYPDDSFLPLFLFMLVVGAIYIKESFKSRLVEELAMISLAHAIPIVMGLYAVHALEGEGALAAGPLFLLLGVFYIIGSLKFGSALARKNQVQKAYPDYIR